MNDVEKARLLLKGFKGESYIHGAGVLDRVGQVAASAGERAVVISGTFAGREPYLESIETSLSNAGVALAGMINGARPNCPREDLMRITASIREMQPHVLISFGGGSTIDAVKAAGVLAALGGEMEPYFGVDRVGPALKQTGKRLIPHMAVQTVASSAAHLTKYANITDLESGQKKLVVDMSIVPPHPVFDYEVTRSSPPGLTLDGAMDGIAHCLEVLYSLSGKPGYDLAKEIAGTGIGLAVNHLPRALEDPHDAEAREALCLATDLGGYAIMVGGTNGAHLTSFSLVDILSHGRACAIMNPYYTVFFAPVVEDALRMVGEIYRDAGYTRADMQRLGGRDLGMAVAEAMFALARKIGFPTRLSEVAGFGRAHMARALTAAKNPQLAMKLQNMPVPLTAEMVDTYMAPVLEAARDGDVSLIKNV